MFVAKLFIVLLIVSASVCSKREHVQVVNYEPVQYVDPVEAEYVDYVEEGHHGPDVNENCPRFHREPCPIENYPSMARFGSPSVRSLEDFLQIVRETSLEHFCSDIVRALSCMRVTLVSIPEKCMMPGQHEGLVSFVDAGIRGSTYLCMEELENIETHLNCFTSKVLVIKAARCVMTPIMGGKCNEDQVRECISRAIDETSSCQEGAKEVFERIASRLAADIQPCAMLEESRNWGRPSIFKFFK